MRNCLSWRTWNKLSETRTIKQDKSNYELHFVNLTFLVLSILLQWKKLNSEFFSASNRFSLPESLSRNDVVRKIEFSKLQLLRACSSRLFSLIKRPRSIDNVYVKRLNAESSFPSHSSQNFSSHIVKIDMSITHDIHTADPKEKSFNLIPVFVIYNKRQLSFAFVEWGTVKNRQQNDESRKQKSWK